jgi:hypothetical protein
MKSIITIILTTALLGLQFAAGAQTLYITPINVEVISSGAKTRAFYPIDDVYITEASSGNIVVKEAANGTILFNGDTSEVEVNGGASMLWSDQQAALSDYFQRVPYNSDTIKFPATYLPRAGLNWLYQNTTSVVKAINSRTKHTLWSGSAASISEDSDVSGILNWIRAKSQHGARHSNAEVHFMVTATAGAAAGTGGEAEVVFSSATSGRIVVTTGTSTTTTGTIATIASPLVLDNMVVTITPANALAAAQLTRVFVEGEGTSVFSLNASGTALSASSEFIYYFRISGIYTYPD